MAHREHRSFQSARAAKPKKITDWSRHYDNTHREQMQALGGGQSRPEPAGPPSRTDDWVAARIADQEAREEADRQAREAAKTAEQNQDTSSE